MNNTTINNAQLVELNAQVAGSALVSYTAVKLVCNGRVLTLPSFIHNAKTSKGLKHELDELSQKVNAAVTEVDRDFGDETLGSALAARLDVEYEKVAEKILELVLTTKKRMLDLGNAGYTMDENHDELRASVMIDHPNEYHREVGVITSTYVKGGNSAFGITLSDMHKADTAIAHVR